MTSCQYLEGHKIGYGAISIQISISCIVEEKADLTFDSTNLLMVARMSWCPCTSSNVSGRYFSTHGRVSSASIGRSLWIRLPFSLPAALNWTSTSIRSSSESDIMRVRFDLLYQVFNRFQMSIYDK